MISQSKAHKMTQLQREYPTYNLGLQDYLHKFYIIKLRKLINLRKGFLDRKCDEFPIAVYDLRIEDMEIDKTQLRFSIADTLERLRTETRNYPHRLQ